MDNAFDYWLVPDTMSIHANASNVTLHAARVDLYDYDKLEPAGNITQLAQYLFDPTNATAGALRLRGVASSRAGLLVWIDAA
jgi:hypothetical protein